MTMNEWKKPESVTPDVETQEPETTEAPETTEVPENTEQMPEMPEGGMPQGDRPPMPPQGGPGGPPPMPPQGGPGGPPPMPPQGGMPPQGEMPEMPEGKADAEEAEETKA